jgi:multicomponent Na+:H+ antiporter subunit A
VTALLLLYLVTGLLVLGVGRALGRTAYVVAAVPAVATLVWLVVRRDDVAAGIDESVNWIPALGVELDLRVDGFAALMLILVAGIGVLVVGYSARYFDQPPTRLIGLLVLFGGAMTGLVMSDDLLVLYGFWELTSVTSFLLIGDRHTDPRARAAALQALLITGAGGLAMLAGFIVLGQAAGTYQLSAILSDPPSGTTVTVALVLILLGAFTKSAQYPFHSWLPAAMVAPTPVSTYLHSATMVKAGVYLVARLAPAFATVAMWRPLVATVGVATMLLGGLRALRQTDLKLLLALGTVSQLGFMMVVLGWGSADAMVAGSVLLLAHGAFKAAAFMAVGILDHQHGTRDLRRLPRPASGWRPAVVVTLVAAASMAGIPLMFGFISKEEAFGALTGATLVGVVVGSILTAAYSYRFAAGAVGRLATEPPSASATARPPAAAFVVPAAVLGVVTVILGCFPGLIDGLVDTSAASLTTLTQPVHLALWHGINQPLILSLVALGGGAIIFAAGPAVARVLRLGTAAPSASDAYRETLRGVNALANRATAIAQPGSLPIYLGIILFTAMVVPGVLLLSGPWWTGWPQLVEIPVHVVLSGLLIASALAAAVVRRRFAGALLLGLVGYVMAGLFVAQGAPDLALTQVAIETLTTVLFVLVLRRLPDRFERSRAARRALRYGVAITVGVVVFGFTLAVGAIDPPTTVSDEMIQDAVPEADGANVVNVILVDFRGLDTLGEITVLTAAAIGTVALARAGRRPTRVGQAEDSAPPPVRSTRMVTIDVSVRIVFAAVIVGSIWLLFAGHNQPGGGFVGGIVAGAAIALRYVQGGLPAVRRLSRGQPWILLGAGLLISSVTSVIPLFFGGSLLESGALSFDLPLFGTIKLTSALFFDIGVYLVVIGLAMMVFESFGDDPVRAEA